MTESPLPLSLVVCTHNRAALVAGLLETLARQDAPRARYEVLAVDNASTDRTPGLLAAWGERLPLRAIREERLGLSHARNRGWREARGVYVAYVDDDCLLPPDWCRAALAVIDAHAPDAFGGPSEAAFDGEPPAWFRPAYLAHDYGPAARWLAAEEFLDGLNMGFRREHLVRLGGFDPALGMHGGTVRYGEETDLQQRLRQGVPGARIRVEPALRVAHRTRRDRARLRWRLRQAWADGRCTRRLFPPDDGRATARTADLAQGVGLLGGIAADVAVRLWLRDRRQYPYWQQFAWEQTAARVARLGALVEALRERRGPCAASPAS